MPVPHPQVLRCRPCRGRGAIALAVALVLGGGAARAQPAPAAEAGGAPAQRTNGLATSLLLDSEVIVVRDRPAGSGTEIVGRATPGVTLVNRGGRLRGSLIYSGTLTARHGVDDREETNYLNSLSASYLLEAIEGVGFVDARASITQQLISAIGGPVSVLQPSSRNRSEVTTVSVSPYLVGNLAGVAEVEARATATETNGGDDAISDSRVQQGLLTLRSPRGRSMLGWSLLGSRQRVKFSGAATPTITDRATGELTLVPDIDWRFAVTAGKERTDVVGALRQSYDNYGASVQWTPSARTTVVAQAERRYFGDAHRVVVEHRFSRSSFRLSSQRDINIGSDVLSQGQAVTLYELYFAQFAAQIPDPIQRDQFVLALIQLQGRNRNEVVSGGLFGNGGVAAQRRQDVLWTWTGPRLTLSANAYTLDSERADTGGVNPAARNDNTAQSGYAASAGWRLTPQTSINLTGSRAMSKDTVSLLRSDLKALSGGLTTQLGPRTAGTLRVGYSVLNGTSDTYREVGITASLSLRF
ncbi:MAG: TIGR03016 family PEP-CTERM system-associated outer membrane protein [Rubrivivax sp.]|nr:TIGR03016 family PEP-CTERM system-associated outer membrane protein [Rubrivivax sp.]